MVFVFSLILLFHEKLSVTSFNEMSKRNSVHNEYRRFSAHIFTLLASLFCCHFVGGKKNSNNTSSQITLIRCVHQNSYS